MRKICFPIDWRLDIDKSLEAMKEAGIDGVLMNFFEDEPVSETAEKVHAKGLMISSVHAPIACMNDIWNDTASGHACVELQKKRIDFCAQWKVPMLIMHAAFINHFPKVSDIGRERIRRLCDYAEEKGVHLCFENVNETELLSAAMECLDEFHGFCWDIGHNMAYLPQCDFNQMFPEKLMYLHIHDNFGTDRPGNPGKDLHLLPFEGRIDWQWFAEQLQKVDYDGDITLETALKPYEDLPYEAFVKRAYEKADRLRNLLD